MMNVFRRSFLAGMGALSMSREHASKLVDELVEAGELREKEARDLVEEMVKKAGEVKKEVESTITKQMDAAHKRMNLASLDHLKKLERRVVELEKKRTPASRPVRRTNAAASSTRRRTVKKAAGT
jgi:poly(hydroxyalkanoate) granule-associated protein